MQRYLVHSDVATTLRFYMDVFPEELKHAAELLSEKKRRSYAEVETLY